jgi:hypothetical protein
VEEEEEVTRLKYQRVEFSSYFLGPLHGSEVLNSRGWSSANKVGGVEMWCVMLRC